MIIYLSAFLRRESRSDAAFNKYNPQERGSKIMAETNEQRVVQVSIESEMKKSYIDYAMSVIVARALPDVRDGLKPVHRRILYAMHGLGFTPDKQFRKAATTVGEVLGKYHPHGDAAVYESMVRMAQDFSLRYLLIDGHGNFGSIDGDPPAAMRYTEARLSKLSMEMLADIEKETVDFMPNFDEVHEEPTVLPAKFPNLLVNGSSGIAVGMATNIPPHNLGEVIDGVITVIDNPGTTIDELMKIIKGPDFPTAGVIVGREGIKEAYHTGRGRIIVRAKAVIEPLNNGKHRIIVTETPYQVNKAALIEKIADLVRDRHIEGISDLRDESDRNGMRIVIELKREANANVVLNQLYKNTQMQDTFGVIMLALVDNVPKTLNLKQIIDHYIDHQRNVIVRRTRFDLNKAEARAHILEGLKIALDNIDAVVNLIKGSKNVPEAKNGLMKGFGLSEIQAQAILDMKLQRLTGLERTKIEEEYRGLLMEIERLRSILASEALVNKIIKDELLAIKAKFADERRTAIIATEEEIDIEDLIQEEECAITLTHFGYIKRMPADMYRSQRRGGKGISGLSTRENDFVENLFITSTHHYILFFTNKGKVYRIKAYDIPGSGRHAKGMAIVNLLELEANESVSAVIPIKEYSQNQYLIMVTKKGLIKKTDLMEYKNIRKNGLTAIAIREDDELIKVRLTDGKQDIIICTRQGMSIRFNESGIRPIGRVAQGVKAVTLREGDEVVGMEPYEEGAEMLAVTENGFGKRTPLSEYRIQSRGGKGIKTYRTTPKTGKIAGMRLVTDKDDIMLISSDGTIIRLKVAGISVMGRATQGVRLMKVEGNNHIVAVARVVAEE